MVDPNEKWEAAQEGAELLREGEHAAAQRLLEQLIVDQPKNEYAYFFLGSAHFEQARYDKAMRAYVTALELAPEYLGAMVSLGHTLRMLQRFDQALRMGNQVLARDKDDIDALFLMGASHFARGDNSAARGYLERFVAQSPDFEAAAEAEGMLQVLRGEVVPAVSSDDEPSN